MSRHLSFKLKTSWKIEQDSTRSFFVNENLFCCLAPQRKNHELMYWCVDLLTKAKFKWEIQNPRSGADLYTGRQNCASSLRKRSLDEGLMSFLEIQCVPSGGPELPQHHKSRLTGSKGGFRCWQGQDHEARSKTPVTTIQKHKPLLEIPMGPPWNPLTVRITGLTWTLTLGIQLSQILRKKLWNV